MDFAPPWLTCRCNGQFARSPIRVMLSALHKSTLDQTAADLGVMLFFRARTAL